MAIAAPFDDADRRVLEEVLMAFQKEFQLHYEDFGEDDTAILSFVKNEYAGERQINEVVERAEGVIVGKVLAKEFGCQWCALIDGGSRQLAIRHNKLAEPLNLTAFRWSKARQAIPKRWFTRLRYLIPNA